MKTKLTLPITVMLAFAAAIFFSAYKPIEELPLNATLPLAEVKMKDVSGKSISLTDAKKDKGLLVIFSCNTCPYVRLCEERIREYSDYCLQNNIGIILVNSNEAQRNEEDSFAEMQKYHAAQQLKCFYTVDENSRLANAFGAGRTPQCFLFDAENKLIYKGAIDDNVKDAAQVKQPYLKDALAAMLSNEKPPVQQTKSIGCTIKRLP